MDHTSVGVFGASGHTGRFVAAELKRRGLSARWIGRNEKLLEQLRDELGHGEVIFARIDDPRSLQAAFRGLRVVINCAGPFFDTNGPVIAAALAAGCHYLDVTAEQITVRRITSSWDSPAREAGIVFIPAMAFFGGLADLMVTSLLEGRHVRSIDTAVALDSWHPTAGTRLTGEQNTTPRVIVREGKLVEVPSPAPTTSWMFPKPFGIQPVTCVALSEIIVLSRHVAAESITSYMTLKPLADLSDASTPPPAAVDDRGRSAQRFVMSVRVTQGDRTTERAVCGQDIYAVTAPLIVEACTRLLAKSPSLTGVRSPAEVFDATYFLDALKHDLVPA